MPVDSSRAWPRRLTGPCVAIERGQPVEIASLQEKLSRTSEPLLTLYVDTDPHDRSSHGRTPAYIGWLKKEMKSVASGIPPSERQSFQEQIRRAERSLRDMTPRERGIVVFAGPATWIRMSLPQAFTNQLHWGPPALSQLLGLATERKTLCVVAIDRAGARFFRGEAGEMAELPEEKFEIDASQWKRKDLGYMAPRDTRMPHGPQRDLYKRRIDEQYRRLCKRVAERARSLCGKELPGAIFLVGSRKLTEQIEAALPTDLRERVEPIAENLARVPPEDLKRHLGPKMAEWTRELAEKHVDQLLGAERGAVTGLDETLAELQKGNIRRVLIVRGFDATVRQCAICGTVGRSAGPGCPVCGGERRELKLGEILPVLARNHKASLEVVDREPGKKLVEGGGIGGWLRPSQPRNAR